MEIEFRQIAPMLLFLLLNTVTTRFSGQPFGRAIPVTMMGAVLSMYIGQFIFHTFDISLLILFGIALIGVVFLVHDAVRQRDRLKKMTLTNGLYSYLIVCCLFLIIDSGRKFNQWDELSHWGMMVREMIRLDRFYADPATHLQVHLDYPPFLSLLELLWVRTARAYSEGGVTMAVHIFMFTCLVPPVMENLAESEQKILPAKRTGLWAAGIGVISAALFTGSSILLVTLFDAEHIFSTIYADYTLPVIYAYLIIRICQKQTFESWFGFFEVLIGVSSLILVKQMGMSFVMLTVFFFFICGVRKSSREEKHLLSVTWAIWIKSAALLIVPYVVSRLWSGYVTSLGAASQFDLSRIRTLQMDELLAGRGDEVRQKTWNAFLEALANRNLTVGRMQLSYVFTALICLLILVLAAIYMIHTDRQRNAVVQSSAKSFLLGRTCRLVLLFAAGTIGYAFAMLLLYMVGFSTEEMERLASYERYMSTYILSEILILWLAGNQIFIRGIRKCRYVSEANVIPASDLPVRRRLRILFPWGCALLVFLFLTDHNGRMALTPQSSAEDTMGNYRNLALMMEYQTQPGDRVMIAANSMSDYQYYLQYFANDRVVDMSVINLVTPTEILTEPESREQVLRALSQDDYIFVVEPTKEMNQFLARPYFGTDFESGQAYAVPADIYND